MNYLFILSFLLFFEFVQFVLKARKYIGNLSMEIEAGKLALAQVKEADESLQHIVFSSSCKYMTSFFGGHRSPDFSTASAQKPYQCYKRRQTYNMSLN